MSKHPVDAVFDLYLTRGEADYIGECITQLEHSLQSGWYAVTHYNKRDKDTIVAAALLHDVGHLLRIEDMAGGTLEQMQDGTTSWGVKGHEHCGADYLKRMGASHQVVELVRSHVDAKRYLVFKRGEEYLRSLSAASKQTLSFQGGPMTKDEALRFEQAPLFDQKIFVRQCDEGGKDIAPPIQAKSLDSYRDIVLRVWNGVPQ